jgi:hypothetical protein
MLFRNVNAWGAFHKLLGAQASCLRIAGILPVNFKQRAGCPRPADKDVGALHS